MEHLTIVHDGEMEKRGGGTWSRKFKKRTFQLQCGATEKRLVYFKGNPDKTKAQGKIDLNAAESIRLNKEKKQILIDTPDRLWVLRAKTVEECETWMQWMSKNPEAAQRHTIRKSIFGQGTLLDLCEFAEYESSCNSDTLNVSEPSMGEEYTELPQIKDSGSETDELEGFNLHSANTLRENIHKLELEELVPDLPAESNMYLATSQ